MLAIGVVSVSPVSYYVDNIPLPTSYRRQRSVQRGVMWFDAATVGSSGDASFLSQIPTSRVFIQNLPYQAGGAPNSYSTTRSSLISEHMRYRERFGFELQILLTAAIRSISSLPSLTGHPKSKYLQTYMYCCGPWPQVSLNSLVVIRVKVHLINSPSCTNIQMPCVRFQRQTTQQTIEHFLNIQMNG